MTAWICSFYIYGFFLTPNFLVFLCLTWILNLIQYSDQKASRIVSICVLVSPKHQSIPYNSSFITKPKRIHWTKREFFILSITTHEQHKGSNYSKVVVVVASKQQHQHRTKRNENADEKVNIKKRRRRKDRKRKRNEKKPPNFTSSFPTQKYKAHHHVNDPDKAYICIYTL